MRNKNRTQEMALSAMLTALVCIATMLIKIPSPLKGYINLGDCVVLLAGWVLSPGYGFLAAGLGSAMADIFSGYLIYAPATFLIKGMMAFVVYYGHKMLFKKGGDFLGRIVPGFFAELLMILGYFVFEGFMYGFVASLVNIPANAVQGVAGIILGVILAKIFDKGFRLL